MRRLYRDVCFSCNIIYQSVMDTHVYSCHLHGQLEYGKFDYFRLGGGEWGDKDIRIWVPEEGS